MAVYQTSSMESFIDEISIKAHVVFDWDNTLKITSADRTHSTCGLSKESLDTLALDKKCKLYIISAIRPTRMNMDTLLLEVDKLGLRSYFCPACQSQGFMGDKCSHDIKPKLIKEQHTYIRWGNIVICEYDKAEVFLELAGKDLDSRTEGEEGSCVYFFDDEDINIQNFHSIVNNSRCVFVGKPIFKEYILV